MNVCRACLSSEKEMIPLNKFFIDAYNILTNLNIALYDDLSQYCCQRCIQTVRLFFDYRGKCITAESTLQQQLLKDMKIKDTLLQPLCSNTDIDLSMPIEDLPSPIQDRKRTKPVTRKLSIVVANETKVEIITKSDIDDDYLAIKQEVKDEECDALFEEFYDTAAEIPSDTEVFIKDETKVKVAKRKTRKCTKLKGKSKAKPKLVPKASKEKSAEPELSCGLCKETFKNKESLSKHLEAHKSKSKYCDICKEFLNNWHALFAHRILHLPQKERRCHTCGKFGRSVPSLEYHYIKEHNNGENSQLSCAICPRMFATPLQLKRHRSTHTLKTYICDYCNKLCNNRHAMKSHIRTHSTVKEFVCDLCGFSCKFNSGMQDHIIRRHTAKKATCKVCHRIFLNQEKLDQHRHKCKPDSKVCPICGLVLRGSKRLNRHMAIHSDVKKYKCSRCPAEYKTAAALRVHTHRHDGVRTKQCEFCRLKFYSSCVLIKHRRIHTGEKPYVCKVCHKGFTGNNNLKVHMKVHGEHLVVKRVKESLDVTSIFK